MPPTVRAATGSDRDFALALVPRLRAFGDPPLRPAETIDAAEGRALERAFAALPADALLLIAEETSGRVGVAYAETATDYFTGERHGHLSILIVAAAGEGRGAGRALIAGVEQWATAKGYRVLTLNVFTANARAREVYERSGFVADTIRYIKALPSSDEDPPIST